jgi:hypothetical protein
MYLETYDVLPVALFLNLMAVELALPIIAYCPACCARYCPLLPIIDYCPLLPIVAHFGAKPCRSPGKEGVIYTP